MYERVLVPTDGSDSADSGAPHGCAVASAFGATVRALGVVDTTMLGPYELDEHVETELREQADAAVARVLELASRAGVPAERTVVDGDPLETILAHADRANLLAMGTHGRTGIQRVALGSLTERVLRHAPVPILTARADTPVPADGYDAVLVPTDGSERAEIATRHALAVAEVFDATVHAINVVDVGRLGGGDGSGAAPEIVEMLEESGHEKVTTVADRARERGLAVTTTVVAGFPAGDIVAYARESEIDLIVMGTHGRTGVERVFLGSTTERVIRNADCAVLAVNPPAERTDPAATEDTDVSDP